ARPRSLGPAIVEGTVVASSGRPVAGAAVSARGLDPAVRTDATGRFVLRGVDANEPLFLRVSKAGHATTNTSYLNPRGPKENLRILVMTNEELQAVEAWAGPKSDAVSTAIVLLNTIGSGGKPISGLNLTPSPVMQRAGAPAAGSTRFGYVEKDGGLTGSAW